MAKINLNTFPYYDDFDAQKGFHRILFKPGYSVQARELTQAQTILQQQIKNFGNHIFKDGSVVFGCAESSNFSVPFVTIAQTTNTASLEGKVVRNEAGVKALVKKVLPVSIPNQNSVALYLQYVAGSNQFSIDTNDVIFEDTDAEQATTYPITSTGVGSLFSVGDGIVYAGGFFVLHKAQTIVIEHNSSTPTKKVGFVVQERIVDVEDDVSLYDPARGTFNFSAPGADRLELTTQLVSYGNSDSVPEGFYILFEIQDGKIKRKYNTTQYAELNKTLARRTFDESGDYTVRSFPLIVREHLNDGTNNGRYTTNEYGDASKLAIAIEPGKAYVRGFEYELFASEYLETRKAYQTETRIQQAITTGYGNYVTATTTAGTWPIQDVSARVSLYTSSNTLVGTARIRDFETLSVVAGANNTITSALQKLYLYDIQLTLGTFAGVDKVVYGNINSPTATATLTESVVLRSSENTPIFKSPYANLSEVESSGYIYRRVFSGITPSSGTVTLSLSGDDSWAFSEISGNDDVFVTDSTGKILKIQQSGTVANSSFVFTILTSFTGTVTVMAKVRKTIAPNLKTYSTGYVKINTTTGAGPYNLGFYDVIDLKGVWKWTGGNTVNYDLTDPLWVDVTANFALDNGQRDWAYDYAKLTKTTSVDFSNSKLVVQVSYFEHTVASGYFDVESYSLPLVNNSPSVIGGNPQINWYEIPVYKSTGGNTYDLRDCIDFRPSVVRLAKVNVTLANASTVDENSSTILSPATGGSSVAIPTATTTTYNKVIHPSPGEEFLADLTYHLPRIDRIVLDSEGVFTVVEGTPSLTPVRPRQPDNAMTLGYINVAPFPSLSPYMGKKVGKPQYTCRVSLVDNRRYTMRDIGEIHKRIDRLEYYTSLSLLETNTANLLIANNVGEDRFKNGILVDSFVGHNIGNVYDKDYNCSIADGELRPAFNLENIEFEVDTLNNLARKLPDATIIVRQAKVGSLQLVKGMRVSSSGSNLTNSGLIEHIVPITETETQKWVRLYLTDVTGIFTANSSVYVGATQVGSITWENAPSSFTLRPVLVDTPADSSLVTLPFSHKVYAENPHASLPRKPSNDLVLTFNGEMKLSPPVDTWMDTSKAPEVQHNEDGKADNWEVLANAWGTQWRNWEKMWQGSASSKIETDVALSKIQNDVAETNMQRQKRQGVGITAEDTRGVSSDHGNRSILTAVVPFMRSIVVNFKATRMKPNARVYAFFDNINVSEHCRLLGSSGTPLENKFGENLVVDSKGEIHGQFRIPEETFTVGVKTFILCDDAQTPSSETITTFANSSFASTGLGTIERNKIMSTQPPQVTFTQQAEVRDITTTRIVKEQAPQKSLVSDPIAQTFFVADNANGIMLSKIDLYFKAKSTTSAITLQIRDVINGFPGETIVPYSTVTLSPEDINISEDASAVTQFRFESPVYLKNDTEYCFVLMPAGNDNNYDVWVSELGDTQLGETQRIDKQPHLGTMFMTANNGVWTENKMEDLKCTIYQCDFDIDSANELILNSQDFVFVKVSAETESFAPGDPVNFVTGTSASGYAGGIVKYVDTRNSVVKVLKTTTGVAGTSLYARKKVLSGTVSTTSTTSKILTGVNSAFASEVSPDDILLTTNWTVVGTVETVSNSAQEITLTAYPTTQFSGQTLYVAKKATVDEIEHKIIHAFSPTLGYLDFNNTDVQWGYKISDTTGAMPASWTGMQPVGTTVLNSAKKVFSATSQADTFLLNASLTSEASNLSPVIDLTKASCIIVENSIKNVADVDADETSKYISRRVVLDDGQEAEDLRVYLTSNIPYGASVKVYAKLLNDTDATTFENRPWLQLDETLPLTPEGFKEYYYTIPKLSTATSNNTEYAITTIAGGADIDGVYTYADTNTGSESLKVKYQGFKSFAVKIELYSSNAAEVPIVRDMRAIALMV